MSGCPDAESLESTQARKQDLPDRYTRGQETVEIRDKTEPDKSTVACRNGDNLQPLLDAEDILSDSALKEIFRVPSRRRTRAC
jgi:hypothetical protein